MRGRLHLKGVRGRLLTAVGVSVGLSVAVLTAGFNFVLQDQLAGDRDGVLRARATSVVDSLSSSGGRLTVPEAPDQGGVQSQAWIFGGSRALERPRATAAIERAAVALAGGPKRALNVAGEQTRLYALPVLAGGKRLGTVVSAVSTRPYDRTARIALLASIVLAAILFVGVMLVARWAIAAALRPVAQMTSDAAEWSEHDLDRRFGLGPPHDELTLLATRLDALLDRLAASLRREQRFSAELSHELRTPLAAVRAEAELALRHDRDSDAYQDALRAILRKAEEMERAVKTLVAAAREQSGLRTGTADAQEAAQAAITACSEIAERTGIELAVSSAARDARVGADADVVERILVPLIENGCRHARAAVTISVSAENGAVNYSIRDDGPGVRQSEHERIFEPGVRGELESHGGAGLGLALSRRLARALGGDVTASAAEGGEFLVRLPAVSAGGEERAGRRSRSPR